MSEKERKRCKRDARKASQTNTAPILSEVVGTYGEVSILNTVLKIALIGRTLQRAPATKKRKIMKCRCCVRKRETSIPTLRPPQRRPARSALGES